MPSPFPGMDPYLEGHLWSSFHADLISCAKALLNPMLRPKYVAFTDKYFLFDSGNDIEVTLSNRYPDLGIGQVSSGTSIAGISLAAAAPLELEAFLPHEIPVLQLQIKDVANMQLVTVIEFLSPVNKRGDGRRKYLEKRNGLLESTAHLLEIDLLRHGLRLPTLSTLPPAAYYVFLSRARRRGKVDVWPIQIDQACPKVSVPLEKGDPDVVLDLQAVVRNAYELGGYELAIDYNDEPDAPWSEDEKAWARRWVAEREQKNCM